MLVLSRKNGESVYIGDSMCVTVLEVSGGRVRLGLSAPVDVPIRRAELRPQEPRFSQQHEEAAVLLAPAT